MARAAECRPRQCQSRFKTTSVGLNVRGDGDAPGRAPAARRLREITDAVQSGHCGFPGRPSVRLADNSGVEHQERAARLPQLLLTGVGVEKLISAKIAKMKSCQDAL